MPDRNKDQQGQRGEEGSERQGLREPQREEGQRGKGRSQRDEQNAPDTKESREREGQETDRHDEELER